MNLNRILHNQRTQKVNVSLFRRTRRAARFVCFFFRTDSPRRSLALRFHTARLARRRAPAQVDLRSIGTLAGGAAAVAALKNGQQNSDTRVQDFAHCLVFSVLSRAAGAARLCLLTDWPPQAGPHARRRAAGVRGGIFARHTLATVGIVDCAPWPRLCAARARAARAAAARARAATRGHRHAGHTGTCIFYLTHCSFI